MKTCSRCQRTLELTEFNRNRTQSDGRQNRCKACDKLLQKEWYSKNRAHRVETVSARRKMLSEFVRTYKDGKPCTDCKTVFPYYVLDFDHREDKEFDLHRAGRVGRSLENLKKEIEKCDLVCANCHRVRTFTRHQSHAAIRLPEGCGHS